MAVEAEHNALRDLSGDFLPAPAIAKCRSDLDLLHGRVRMVERETCRVLLAAEGTAACLLRDDPVVDLLFSTLLPVDLLPAVLLVPRPPRPILILPRPGHQTLLRMRGANSRRTRR